MTIKRSVWYEDVNSFYHIGLYLVSVCFRTKNCGIVILIKKCLKAMSCGFGRITNDRIIRKK